MRAAVTHRKAGEASAHAMGRGQHLLVRSWRRERATCVAHSMLRRAAAAATAAQSAASHLKAEANLPLRAKKTLSSDYKLATISSLQAQPTISLKAELVVSL